MRCVSVNAAVNESNLPSHFIPWDMVLQKQVVLYIGQVWSWLFWMNRLKILNNSYEAVYLHLITNYNNGPVLSRSHKKPFVG
jgi:hypothetical protein